MWFSPCKLALGSIKQRRSATASDFGRHTSVHEAKRTKLVLAVE